MADKGPSPSRYSPPGGRFLSCPEQLTRGERVLLDTSVISELTEDASNYGVPAFLTEQDAWSTIESKEG